jgi:hypothetical protein
MKETLETVNRAARREARGALRCLAAMGAAIALLCVLAFPAAAQYGSASISATVVDRTGGVVPNAKVVLKNEQSGITRETVTNSSGVFVFPSVPPGSYTVTVSFTGLETWEGKGIVLTQGATVNLPNVVLEVAGTRQEIQVSEAAEVVVPVDSGQFSQTLNRQMVEDLTIVGRNAAELIKIMPGMAMTSGLGQTMWNSYVTATNSGPIGAFSAAGTQPNGAMTMTSDGANLLDPGNQGTQTANINQNQVQEVTVLTSAYGAEFAKGPITFQAIGKSGGAQFHGSGYLYARHGKFNALDSYQKSQGIKKESPDFQVDKFYYPGGDLGGPVLIPGTGFNKNRDKLFFYTAYEYMKQQPVGELRNYFVPTDQMLQGNFSREYLDTLGPNFANARSQANTLPGGNALNDGIEFPGGRIPASLFDKDSMAYLKLFPKPNTDPRTNSTGSNYQFLANPPQDRWEYRIRTDYNISQNTKLFFSWNHQSELQKNPIAIWWTMPSALPYPSPQDARQTADVLSANLVHVFSPTLTNEFIFAKARFLNPVKLVNPDAVNPSKIGFTMTGLFENPFLPQIPNTYGWGNSAVGFATYPYGAPWAAGGANAFGKLSDTPNISNNLTKLWGTHTLKTGFYWDFARNNQTGGGYDMTTQGGAAFENWGARSTGNPLADWITGRITQFGQMQNAPVTDFKYYTWAFYVSDQWKVNRRLTLTLGMRFEHLGNWVPLGDHPGLAVWDPARYDNTSNAKSWTGHVWNAIDKSIPKSGWPSRTLFPEPRFGFAYDLFGDGKTILRGGAGLYRYQIAYNTVSGQAYSAPLDIPQYTTLWGCCVGWHQFKQYSPALGPSGLGSSVTPLKKGDDRVPYTWTYNFTVSRRLPWRSVAEFQYQGNRSEDMLIRGALTNINAIPFRAFFGPNPRTGQILDPFSSDFPVNDYRPLANYSNVELISHGSYSRYNAFIATWQKQSGRVTFTTNYTFSKVLGVRDNVSDNGASSGATLWPFGLRENYGVLSWDRTHIFNAAYVVNMPGISTKNKFLGGVVNGWTLSGITQMQSGAPIQPNTGGTLNALWPGGFTNQNQLGTNSVTLVPRVICDPRKNLPDGHYFNPACFAPPPGNGLNGDIIWPYIKGPAFFNSDLAAYKTFSINERHKIQFRFSAFNWMNHPLPQFGAAGSQDVQLNFATSTGQLSQTNQNRITSGKPLHTVGRRVTEFTLKYTF